ncbi:MAG: hypothetical protein CO141_03125 [Candidatus Moranbacteria bacterium CG_4_9_14_3_um_filter_42_9]|nr:MAG: hypothetical protein CO141_03125 [Candidatus Moranbacteria bacterium CG_4_9_14_3_um_filter_42_9]
MGDDFRKYLRDGEARLGGLKKEEKNIFRAIAILILSMGVFFYPAPKSQFVFAESRNNFLCQDKNEFWCGINTEIKSELVSANVGKNFPCQFEKSFWCEAMSDSGKKIPTEEVKQKAEISLDELTPEKKLGTFVYKKSKGEQAIDPAHCSLPEKNVSVVEIKKGSVFNLVAGHPIEKMIPFIEKRDREVASFLVAIAKKESDWGIHSPQKSGRECYNYWGYRGKENTTESGYSCFDNPEHAVQVVGDRIENLLNKKIDTPTKMVVWKCGRDCEAAGGQAAANKWIMDVAHIYTKLQS